ncbi:mitochondrial Oma1 zinc metallopeptidase-like protein [Andalucia godoyi]|uniref:Mitochondrial Oma1 zinc metallopeptidase-like protein n=1 Tax=Andalucia godoyi TaxID=505711 RepID=A0A8K0AHP1_ANDGO|nr:mitochondrial Oma1 zinc metallopeptidase-like protein [Andalucia godoyi]|eukprot:ANDGO_00528.mRNA.1 mitochondrial Oma1 zinc metallopeptidase homolog (peptidase M48 superfamily member)
MIRSWSLLTRRFGSFAASNGCCLPARMGAVRPAPCRLLSSSPWWQQQPPQNPSFPRKSQAQPLIPLTSKSHSGKPGHDSRDNDRNREDDSNHTNVNPPRFQWSRQHTILVVGSVGLGVYVVFHLERVPFSDRLRIMDVTEATEIELGERHYRQLLARSKVLPASHVFSRRVAEVGSRIAAVADKPQFKFEFHVVEDPSVNAACLPGGKVIVNSGLFRIIETDAELSAVMGHEVSHAILRHSAEKLSYGKILNILYYALMLTVGDVRFFYNLITQIAFELPNSRKMELEADRMGLILMARACYDPSSAPKVFRKLGKGDSRSAIGAYLSTHPVSDDRIQNIQKHLEEAMQIRADHCSGNEDFAAFRSGVRSIFPSRFAS